MSANQHKQYNIQHVPPLRRLCLGLFFNCLNIRCFSYHFDHLSHYLFIYISLSLSSSTLFFSLSLYISHCHPQFFPLHILFLSPFLYQNLCKSLQLTFQFCLYPTISHSLSLSLSHSIFLCLSLISSFFLSLHILFFFLSFCMDGTEWCQCTYLKSNEKFCIEN